MTIIEALKGTMYDYVRVTYDNRWLVWDSIYNGWVVYEHKYRAKKATEILYTQDEAEAVATLLAE